MGGAAATPGTYRQGEQQSAGNNQNHPAHESAKSNFSYSDRGFSGFENRDLVALSYRLSSSNATEGSRGSPKSLPHSHDGRFGAGDSVLVHIIEFHSQTTPSYATGKPPAPELRKPDGFARQRFGDELRDAFEILRLRKNNHALRFVFPTSLRALRIFQAVGALVA